MPRDPSGNYSLPALGNPAITNTPITIAWWNGTSTDVASTLTDSLSRSGLGGMLVPFKLVDGSPSAPAFAFQSESNTGFYRPTANELDVVVGGTRFSRWTAASGFQSSGDNGATWVNPIYREVAGQTMGALGALDFAVGKLTIASIPVTTTAAAPVVTRSTTSTGLFTTTSTSLTAVTNANISFTATGRPVFVQIVADDTASLAQLGSVPTSGATTPALGQMDLALSSDVGSTFFARQHMVTVNILGIGYTGTGFAPSGFSTWYAPAAGAATIGLYTKAYTGTNSAVLNCKLLIVQF